MYTVYSHVNMYVYMYMPNLLQSKPGPLYRDEA